MLKWLYEDSKRLGTEKQGGIILDEMAIQEDLQFHSQHGAIKTEGLVDLGEACADMKKMNTQKDDLKLAKYILQFIYLGFDGFRFPVAFYPTGGVNAPELYITVWDMISVLSEYEFSIRYVCFDGGSSNRSFQLMHFKDKEEAFEKNFTTTNPFHPNESVTLLMDFSHNMKKLRNNIYSSGDTNFSKRKLQLKGEFILWVHWINAYNWDR